jgi:ribosome-binding protein aMBF1 (putative translation factor)
MMRLQSSATGAKTMGMIVRFPARHARASQTSRAARLVRSSAVTQFAPASSVANTAAHHSAGMLSLCHHLETADAPAPISAAIASREGQSSMIERNEVIPQSIGQTVLKRKANPSLDSEQSVGHYVRMRESDEDRQYKQELTRRVAEARISRGWTQRQAAEALGMPQDKYKQYEGRSIMPPRLYERFCLIFMVNLVWLVTGKGKKPPKPLKIVAQEVDEQVSARPKPKKNQRRATRVA